MTTHVLYTRFRSPLGHLLLTATGCGLSGLYLEGGRHVPEAGPAWRADSAPFRDATRQIEEYFRGERREFDLPLDLAGTPFELEVWEALRQIPYGQTISYGELARRIGRPGAVRAVGAANGHNPISIVIPCHRVLGANGALTGYGGGLERKRALLDLEARVSGPAFRPPS